MIYSVFYKNIILPLSIVLLYIIISCGFQVINKLDVYIVDNNIVFSSAEVKKGITQDKLYLLLDLEVLKKDCIDNCKWWYIVRNETKESLMLNKDNTILGNIVYGHRFQGMNKRVPPKELTPGKYSVSATVEVFDRNENPLRSMLLHRNFLLQRDNSNSIKIQYLD